MKVPIASLAAFVATASAIPIRVITLTGPIAEDYLPADLIHPSHDNPAAHHTFTAPCHGQKTVPPSFGASLLSRLGLAPPTHRPHHLASEKWAHPSFGDIDGELEKIASGWKEMVDSTSDRVVPILQGGAVRILPIMDDQGNFDHYAGEKHRQHSDWKKLEGKGGVKAHHHKGHGHHGPPRSRGFLCRLGKALSSLSAFEATAVMFVLGAGLGSLLHLVFAVIFLSVRRLRGGKSTCAERRAARRARRAARKEAKEMKKQGQIVLSGTENEEVLPSYEEGETARLVEKA